MSRKQKEAQEIIKKIEKMNVKSEHFFEIYKAVSSKYWDFGIKPNDFEKAACALVMFAERGDADHIIVCTKIAQELIKMRKSGSRAAKLTFGFSDEEYRVDIYTDGIELEKMDTLLEQAVEQGFSNIGRQS